MSQYCYHHCTMEVHWSDKTSELSVVFEKWAIARCIEASKRDIKSTEEDQPMGVDRRHLSYRFIRNELYRNIRWIHQNRSLSLCKNNSSQWVLQYFNGDLIRDIKEGTLEGNIRRILGKFLKSWENSKKSEFSRKRLLMVDFDSKIDKIWLFRTNISMTL